MNTCKTCKHWVLDKDEYEEIANPYDPDTYEPMKFDYGVRICKSPMILFWEHPITGKHATLVDGSGYAANLLTGGDFGCVNHEIKTP